MGGLNAFYWYQIFALHSAVVEVQEMFSWHGSPRGGGTLIFSAYVGSDPASTVHPKKYQEFQAPKKIFEILVTKKISQFCTLTLKKDPKLYINDSQTNPIL